MVRGGHGRLRIAVHDVPHAKPYLLAVGKRLQLASCALCPDSVLYPPPCPSLSCASHSVSGSLAWAHCLRRTLRPPPNVDFVQGVAARFPREAGQEARIDFLS